MSKVRMSLVLSLHPLSQPSLVCHSSPFTFSASPPPFFSLILSVHLRNRGLDCEIVASM